MNDKIDYSSKFLWDDDDLLSEDMSTGIVLTIGEREIHIGPHEVFNEFLNEVSKVRYLNTLMTKSFVEGKILARELVKPTLKKCSAKMLYSELKSLGPDEDTLSDVSLQILDQLIQALRIAIEDQEDIIINP